MASSVVFIHRSSAHFCGTHGRTGHAWIYQIPDGQRYSSKNLRLLGILLAVVIVATIVQSVATFLLTKLVSIRAHQLIAEFRQKIHAHIIRLPVSFFTRHKSGELVSRIMNDVEGVRNLIGTGFVQLIGGVLTAAISLVILILIEPVLTFIAVLFMVIFGVVSIYAFSRMRPLFRERNRVNAQVTGRLTEGLGGIQVIKGFHTEAKEQDIFSKGVYTLLTTFGERLPHRL